MPLRPATKVDIKTLASLLLPTYLRLQSHPVLGKEAMKAGLEELEKMLDE